MWYVHMVHVAMVIAMNSFQIRQQDTEFVDSPILKSQVMEVAGIPEVCGVTVKVLELGIPLTPESEPICHGQNHLADLDTAPNLKSSQSAARHQEISQCQLHIYLPRRLQSNFIPNMPSWLKYDVPPY